MASSLTIPSSTRHLARVRRFVSERARAAGLDDESVAELRLAVDEACTNAIEHAYHGRDDGSVTIETGTEDGNFVVTVRHAGVPFDPRSYEPVPLAEAVRRRRRGGFGVALMNCLCDEVEYDRRGPLSVVRLSKRLAS